MKRNYKTEYNHFYKEALEMAKRYGTSSGIELYFIHKIRQESI